MSELGTEPETFSAECHLRNSYSHRCLESMDGDQLEWRHKVIGNNTLRIRTPRIAILSGEPVVLVPGLWKKVSVL